MRLESSGLTATGFSILKFRTDARDLNKDAYKSPLARVASFTGQFGRGESRDPIAFISRVVILLGDCDDRPFAAQLWLCKLDRVADFKGLL